MQDEIKFQSNLGQLLLRAFRWFDESLLNHLHAAGWHRLARPHSLVFAYLDESGTRPSEIARRIGVSRQAVHQTVSELEELGLVETVADPISQRAKLVVLTSLGRESVAAARKVYAGLEDELAQRMGRAGVRALRRALEADWGPPSAGQL